VRGASKPDPLTFVKIVHTLIWAFFATCILTLPVAVLASCNSPEEAPPDPGDASYSMPYDPPLLVDVTSRCDRLLAYAIVSLGRRFQSFDLSVNMYDDCRRSGGGFASWGVLILGRYSVSDTSLTFTPDSPGTPPFSGAFDAMYVRLMLPPRADSLAPTAIPVELGPKMPFR
jgi:hypothetical protein